MMLRRSGLLMDHPELEMVRPRRARARAIGRLVLAPCLVVAAPGAAWAAAPTQEPAPTGEPAPASSAGSAAARGPLRVTVEPRIEDATLIPRWIAERSATTVGRLEESASREESIEVRIGGETYAYRIEVQAMRAGKPVGVAREAIPCECTSEEMLALVEREVSRAVEELEQPVIDEPESTDPEPAPSEPSNGKEPVRAEPPPRWLLPTGAALTAVGGAGLVAGVVMIAVGEQPIRTEGIQIVRGRDWRNPAGYVALGVGAGALAGGVAMLVLHHLGCKRAPGSCGGEASSHAPARRAWVVAPWIGGGELGVGVVGRFSGRSK